MDFWKICGDDDKNTPVDMLDALNVRLAVNVGVPSVKYNALSVPGMQGVLDLTEAFGGALAYNPRECTLFAVSESGSANARAHIELFLRTYQGRRVRLVNTTQNYMLIGRLTEATIQSTDTAENYKLSFKLIADPLRYDVAETVRNDILPVSTPSNQWQTLTGFAPGANQEYTVADGIEVPAGDIAEVKVTTEKTKYYRFTFSNITNCKIRVVDYDNASDTDKIISYNVDYSKPYLPIYGDVRIVVEPADDTKPCNVPVAIRVYESVEIVNSGLAVPIKVAQTISTETNNIYVMNGNFRAKIRFGNDFNEYPQLMLNAGTNRLLVYASSLNFNADSLTSNEKVILKWRGGDI